MLSGGAIFEKERNNSLEWLAALEEVARKATVLQERETLKLWAITPCPTPSVKSGKLEN